MPHLILTLTNNLAQEAYVPAILTELAVALAEFETIDSRSIKSYAMSPSQWVMGEGAPEGFVHLEVAILSGRPPELRQAIAQRLASIVQHHYQVPHDEGRASLTLELREMDRDTYQK